MEEKFIDKFLIFLTEQWWDWNSMLVFLIMILATALLLYSLGALKGKYDNGSWGNLGQELHKRYSAPFKQPSVAIYFFVALIFGALGVWYSIIESVIINGATESRVENIMPTTSLWFSEPVFRALLTYFPALGVVSCVQIIISEDEKKGLRSLFSFLLLFLLAAAVVAAVIFSLKPKLAVFLVQLGVVVAAASWWLANGLTKDLFEKADPVDALGGDIDEPVYGQSTEYKT